MCPMTQLTQVQGGSACGQESYCTDGGVEYRSGQVWIGVEAAYFYLQGLTPDWAPSSTLIPESMPHASWRCTEPPAPVRRRLGWRRELLSSPLSLRCQYLK